MSSRCRNRLAALAALALALPALLASEREERQTRPKPAAAALANTIRLSPLQPGKPDDRAVKNDKGESAYAVAQGETLYRAYNCVGCHANGGGGMGPPLMDDKWIYGGDAANVVATILEGRPNGMPSFAGRIPEDQVWEIAAYVRSMAGLLPKDVSPGRTDHMSAKAPESATAATTPVAGGSVPPAGQGTQQ